jgi:hypothetical protein
MPDSKSPPLDLSTFDNLDAPPAPTPMTVAPTPQLPAVADPRLAPEPALERLGACPFNRFGRTCGEYDSPKQAIRSLGFYLGPPDWRARKFSSPRFGDLRLFRQAPSTSILRFESYQAACWSL